jgi:hypothetical protein
MTCATCDGYGVISSKSGGMNPDLNTLLQPSKKGGSLSLAQVQDYISKVRAISQRDTTINTICSKCGGHCK